MDKQPAFELNQVWKMNVAERSHVTAPYYVRIILVGIGEIVTSIPGAHSLTISQHGENANWDYHIPRMEYVGTMESHGHLLFDQNIEHKPL